MLQVHDIRETRVYKEGVEEGIEKERQRNRQEKVNLIAKLAARNLSAAEIADILDLDLEFVLKAIGRTA